MKATAEGVGEVLFKTYSALLGQAGECLELYEVQGRVSAGNDPENRAAASQPP